jgi:DNA-directed RNA polymerase I, II, and III subunit RPABC2
LGKTNSDDSLHPKYQMSASTFVERSDVVAATDPTERITQPYFTKYEYTALLACRAQQLAEGATPLVPLGDFNTADPRFVWKVAEREILDRKLPYLVRRELPGGGAEFWSVAELELAW